MCAGSSVHGVLGGPSACFIKLLNIFPSLYITCIEYVFFFCVLHWPTNLCDDVWLDILMLKVSNEQWGD
jgi:hypothetical protein